MIYPASSVRRIYLALALAILTGCASQPQVEYRVAKIPEPPRIERPDLGSLNITYSMKLEEIVQIMREDIKKLQATIMQYEKALDVYRNKETK